MNFKKYMCGWCDSLADGFENFRFSSLVEYLFIVFVCLTLAILISVPLSWIGLASAGVCPFIFDGLYGIAFVILLNHRRYVSENYTPYQDR